ncbi:MAG: hypothetical protein AAF266_04040 [Planctomycetota bacterium]
MTSIATPSIRCLALAVTLSLATPAAASFDFDDIRFWIGEGENRAAVVIDWSIATGTGGSAAWGYRWADGESPTGADLLLAVLEGDANLFAKLDDPAAPEIVYSLGLNAPGSASFALTSDPTTFDPATGIAASGPPPGADPAEAIDRYREGWEALPIPSPGFWHYAVADTSPYVGGAWTSSTAGLAERFLSDGAWDAWTFDPTFRSIAFADEPVAAPTPAEAAPLAGDYNRDGLVDAADYTLWRDSEGTTALFLSSGADGDANGVIDAADESAWRERYGRAADFTVAIPEPSAAALVGFLVLTLSRYATKERA